jgi:two-component system phosphate regulon sensor histidine kinase PhoR
VLVLHDVTELRRLENVRRDFVANVSHELKTPLTAIRGWSRRARRRRCPTTRAGASSRRCASRRCACPRWSPTCSRSRASRPAVSCASRARRPARSGESTRAPVAAPPRTRDRAPPQLADDACVVSATRTRLRQIATNLLDNALKYTPAKGHVTVRLSRGPMHAILEVKDDGIGIERKHLDRIFQRFYRVDQARSRELGGTGLGLSIVKHVVLAHGGDVNVESSPGQGSVFRVRIPLA